MSSNIAFRCILQYNSSISKLKKFFEDTDIIKIGVGKAGIILMATAPGEVCHYMIKIHTCDIYKLYIDNNMWPSGCIIRAIPAQQFTAFIKAKEVNNDLMIEVDKDGILLSLSVKLGDNIIRSTSINMSIPNMSYEYINMLNANVVLHVNEFKKLCADMAKESKDIMLEHQDDAIRITSGATKVTYGIWKEKEISHICHIKNTAFVKATKINIGNTKNSLAGIYANPDYPIMIKAKLGIIDFIIYTKKWIK